MHQLNSKNYKDVSVFIRGEEVPFVLPPDRGSMLMQYLTGDQKATHIRLTDVGGTVIVVNIRDIQKVVPDLIDKKLTYKADW